MSSKVVKEDKTKGRTLKEKYGEFRNKHKKGVTCGIAGVLFIGGLGLGVMVNNVYYNYLAYKQETGVGIDGNGIFFDPLLNYIIQFPHDWGYSVGEEETTQSAIDESGVKNQSFDLDKHKLKYEITPVVFAKEGENPVDDSGYRSFMSVSFRGFYGTDLSEAKEPLKKELVELLNSNGHKDLEFKIDKYDAGEVPFVSFDIKTKEETSGATVYYTQVSKVIGVNICTVILGTTDEYLARNTIVRDLILNIQRTDPSLIQVQENSPQQNVTQPNSITSSGSSWYNPNASSTGKTTESQESSTEKQVIDLEKEGNQSIPVEGGTLEIVNGVDIDVDALKDLDGVTVEDITSGANDK